jgi:hypothetical protein
LETVMAYLELCIDLKDGGHVRLIGGDATYWRGLGLPDYKGPVDGLAEAHPDVVAELCALGALRAL